MHDDGKPTTTWGFFSACRCEGHIAGWDQLLCPAILTCASFLAGPDSSFWYTLKIENVAIDNNCKTVLQMAASTRYYDDALQSLVWRLLAFSFASNLEAIGKVMFYGVVMHTLSAYTGNPTENKTSLDIATLSQGQSKTSRISKINYIQTILHHLHTHRLTLLFLHPGLPHSPVDKRNDPSGTRPRFLAVRW